MSKAVAVHAIVLVIIIAMFVIVAIIAFGGYLGIQNEQLGKAACMTKTTRFCTEWFTKDTSFSTGKPDWWGTTEPKNCDQYGTKEPTAEQCNIFSKK